MNIIEAAEQLKAGKLIQRTEWGGQSVGAALVKGEYLLYLVGSDLQSSILPLLYTDYFVSETEDQSETTESSETV